VPHDPVVSRPLFTRYRSVLPLKHHSHFISFRIGGLTNTRFLKTILEHPSKPQHSKWQSPSCPKLTSGLSLSHFRLLICPYNVCVQEFEDSSLEKWGRIIQMYWCTYTTKIRKMKTLTLMSISPSRGSRSLLQTRLWRPSHGGIIIWWGGNATPRLGYVTCQFWIWFVDSLIYAVQ
jgi:hypothetical protein